MTIKIDYDIKKTKLSRKYKVRSTFYCYCQGRIKGVRGPWAET